MADIRSDVTRLPLLRDLVGYLQLRKYSVPGQLVGWWEKQLPANYTLSSPWTYEYVTNWTQDIDLPCDCLVLTMLTMVFETTTTADYFNRMAGRVEYDYASYVCGWYDVIHNTNLNVMAVNSRTVTECCELTAGAHTARAELMGGSTSGVTLVTANNARSKITILAYRSP